MVLYLPKSLLQDSESKRFKSRTDQLIDSLLNPPQQQQAASPPGAPDLSLLELPEEAPAPTPQPVQPAGLPLPSFNALTSIWNRDQDQQQPQAQAAQTTEQPQAQTQTQDTLQVPTLESLLSGGLPRFDQVPSTTEEPEAEPTPRPEAPASRTGAVTSPAAPVPPDVEPTRETVTQAAAHALTKAGLPADMAPHIAAIAINEGILVPGTIARDHWSVGGVKAGGTAGSVTVPTREFINGQWVTEQGTFGKFNSMQEGMDALAEFVRDSPRFGPVTQAAAATGDYSGLIEGFRQKGYATDPNWTTQVNGIAAGLPRPQPATPPPPTGTTVETTPNALEARPPTHDDHAGHDHADDYEVSFGFNEEYSNPFNPNIPRHRGIDLVVRGAPEGGRGTPVRAFRGGTVEAVTVDPNGGNGVILRDEQGLYHRYFHFDRLEPLERGQRIAAGSVLGVLGDSGTRGSPHLHFEVSRGLNGDPMDQLIDPRPYMRPTEPPVVQQASGDEGQGAMHAYTQGESTGAFHSYALAEETAPEPPAPAPVETSTAPTRVRFPGADELTEPQGPPVPPAETTPGALEAAPYAPQSPVAAPQPVETTPAALEIARPATQAPYQPEDALQGPTPPPATVESTPGALEAVPYRPPEETYVPPPPTPQQQANQVSMEAAGIGQDVGRTSPLEAGVAEPFRRRVEYTEEEKAQDAADIAAGVDPHLVNANRWTNLMRRAALAGVQVIPDTITTVLETITGVPLSMTIAGEKVGVGDILAPNRGSVGSIMPAQAGVAPGRVSRYFERAGDYIASVPRGIAEAVRPYVGRATPPAPAAGIIPEDYARDIPTPVRLPEDPTFARAVEGTEGAEILEDAIRLPLIRGQNPDQALGESVRTGVFYGTNRRDLQKAGYSTGRHGYGGTQVIEGSTLVKAPLAVQAGQGGGAPQKAYDQLRGRGAYDAMRMDVLRSAVTNRPLISTGDAELVDRVEGVLRRYGADPDQAWNIVTNSRSGNQLAYAIQENIVAHETRAAGYDSVVGYSRGATPRITEVFDVRESVYPNTQGDFGVHPEFEARPGPQMAGIVPESDRYYHGTAGAFDRPDPGRFDPNGLFGPGYYLTSDARVAGSYGVAREDPAAKIAARPREDIEADLAMYRRHVANAKEDWERNTWQKSVDYLEDILSGRLTPGAGPNIRPVDVPRNLNLLDADAPTDAETLARVSRAAGELSIPIRSTGRSGPGATNENLFHALRADVDDSPWASTLDRRDMPAVDAAVYRRTNEVLARAGYDGIRHRGGQINPMFDDAGNPIEHDVTVVFPESLDKIRNALSGTPGGFVPATRGANLGEVATSAVTGAVAGGIGAAQAGEGPEGIAQGAYAGAARGAITRYGLGRAGFNPGRIVRVASERALKGDGPSQPSAATRVLESLEQANWVPPRVMAEMLGERPEYLDPVIDVMVAQREKFNRGQMTARDLAKAYYMTVASQGTGAIDPAIITEKTGLVIPEEFLSVSKGGKVVVRPEEAAAAWLFSREGYEALGDIEEGVFNRAAWEAGARVRAAFGDDRFHTNNVFGTRAPVKKGRYNMENLYDLMQEVNATAGDIAQLDKVLVKLNGVSTGKVGFVKHMLGFGDTPTIDAVEMNAWLTGQGDTSKLTGPSIDLLQRVRGHYQDKRVAQAVADRITKNFAELRELGVGADLDPQVANHIVHHWLWDKFKGTKTDHKGMYKALQSASFVPGMESAGAAAAGAAAGGEEASPEERATLAGAGLAAGMALRRGETGPLARVATRTLSETGRQVFEKLAELTPERVSRARERALQIATDAVVGGSKQVQPGVRNLLEQAMTEIERGLQENKVVATGLRGHAVGAFLKGQGVTTKADAGSRAAIDKITRKIVNVAGGRAGEPYTLEQAAAFTDREALQMEMALGGSRLPTREGVVDAEAPRTAYAYVSEGQPMIGPNVPDVWVIWDDAAPRVTTAHHAYALGSPNQDIHASMPPGLRAALWAEANAPQPAVRGAEMGVGPEGQPILTDYGRIKLPNGRTIADTDWLVGPEGEDTMRAAGLLMGMPDHLRARVASGEISDPAQLAAVMMRGAPLRTVPTRGGVISATRSESLLIDPSLENIKAIYVTGGQKKGVIPNTGGKNRVEAALAMRERILEETGRDVPVLSMDRSGKTSPFLKDAKVLAGEPLELAPGRPGIAERYGRETDPSTGEPYRNIGGFAPVDVTGAAAGAMAGDEDTTAEERAQMAALGMVAGRVIRTKGITATPQGQAVRRVAGAINKQAQAVKQRPVNAIDWVQSWRYGMAMLGSPATGLMQALGGLVEAGVGVPVEVLRTGILRGHPDHLVLEGVAAAHGLAEGVKAAVQTALGKVPKTITQNTDYMEPLSERLDPSNTAGRLAAGTIETPGRVFTQAPDAFWYSTFYRTGLAQAASEEAGRQGARIWRPGQSMNMQLQLYLNPTPEVEARAHEIARKATFKGDMGYFGKVGEKAIRGGPGASQIHQVIGSDVMPFYKTIYNIHTNALENVPILGMAAKSRTDEKLARQAVGAVLGYYLYNQATAGNITGPGPDDPDKVAELRQLGWEPNSTRVAGYWVPNAYFGSVGPALNAIGAYRDAVQYGKPGETDIKFAERIMKNLGRSFDDYPLAQSIGLVASLLEDGGVKALEDHLAGTASSFVPGALRTWEMSQDPLNRRARREPSATKEFADSPAEIEGAFRQRSGVGRQELPPATDLYGRPLPNPRQGWAALGPRLGTSKDDPIAKAYLDAQVDIGKPKTELSVGGTAFPLSPEETEAWKAARGRVLLQQAPKQLESPNWAGRKPEAKAAALTAIKDAANEAADATLLKQLGGPEVTRRVRAARAVKKAS